MSEGGSGAEAQAQPAQPPPTSPASALPAVPVAAAAPPVSRVVLSESEAASLSQAEWGARWRQQDTYIATLERRLGLQEGELEDLRQSTDKMKSQLSESQQRERVLMRRLTAKEQETQDYLCQLNELKSTQVPSATSLRSSLLDPAVNCILQHLKSELQQIRSKLEETQNEMTAWKFTPDSNTGKRLMAKCRLLYQENEELGKITSSGRIAKLETDLALQKSFSEEVRQSQNELDSLLADLDEDVEAMQSTILILQTELRKTNDTAQVLQKENSTLKLLANGRSNGDSSGVTVTNCEHEHEHEHERIEHEHLRHHLRQDVNRTDESEESDSAERTSGSSTNNVNKRVRRSSVLSIDYNEDDALVINTNGDVVMTSDNE